MGEAEERDAVQVKTLSRGVGAGVRGQSIPPLVRYPDGNNVQSLRLSCCSLNTHTHRLNTAYRAAPAR